MMKQKEITKENIINAVKYLESYKPPCDICGEKKQYNLFKKEDSPFWFRVCEDCEKDLEK